MFPQEIQDQSIPLLTGSMTPVTGQNSNPVVVDAVVPTTHVDVAFPPVVVAQETISQSLNTETKSILGQYTFEQLGAILVGLFQQGVSGEIKISSNGIVSRNVNGDTTVGIDATTGNATFLGTLQAGSLIAGDSNVVIDKGSNGGRILLYNSGIPQIVIGDPT